ncbi:MAG: hypothetical protein JWO63_710, partial [Frankiales bacterium]|nr:hypothetical protein [Frankiales bacterium]
RRAAPRCTARHRAASRSTAPRIFVHMDEIVALQLRCARRTVQVDGNAVVGAWGSAKFVQVDGSAAVGAWWVAKFVQVDGNAVVGAWWVAKFVQVDGNAAVGAWWVAKFVQVEEFAEAEAEAEAKADVGESGRGRVARGRSSVARIRAGSMDGRQRRPAERRGAPGESSAEGTEQYSLSGLESAVRRALVQQQGNRGRTGVADARDIRELAGGR